MPEILGQNVDPETPVPLNVPIAGVAVSATQGSPWQNGPIRVIFEIGWYMNTSISTGIIGQDEPVAVTVTPFVISPAGAALQFT